MVTSILSLIFNMMKWIFVIYFIASLLLKRTKFFTRLEPYAERILSPFRNYLRVLIPQTANWKIDISPLALALVLQILAIAAKLLGKLI